MALLVLVSVCSGNEFSEWLKRDRLMQRDTGTPVQISEFKMFLPAGWVRGKDPIDDDFSLATSNTLIYVGHDTGVTSAESRVVFYTESLPEGSAGNWPITVPKWEHMDVAGLPCVRIADGGAPDGMTRFLVYANTRSAQYVLQFDVPGRHADWPVYAQRLVRTLSYTGGKEPLRPPSVSPADRGRMSADDLRQYRRVFANSPFYPYTLKTRYAIQTGVDPARENYLCILNDARDALALRLHLIRNASRSIKIQTFIFSHDETGRLLMHELIEAAKRGVQVRILADHITSSRDLHIMASLVTAHPNLQMKHYRPVGDRLDPSNVREVLDYIIPNATNQRMHNKLFIVDDVLFITGGRNIENGYYGQSMSMNFKDRDVLTIGPVVAYAAGSFEEYWHYKESVSTETLKDVAEMIRTGGFRRYETREDFEIPEFFKSIEEDARNNDLIKEKFVKSMHKAQRALFLSDLPGKQSRFFSLWGRGRISRQLEAMIGAAEHSVILQSPYLIMDGRTRKLFRKMKAARPELDLKVSSNSFGSTDNILAYSANYKLRSACIEDAGLTIYEYKPHPADLPRILPNYSQLEQRVIEWKKTMEDEDKPFLCIHAKGFVVDNLVAYIGSFNLDPRSANLNTEVGLLVEDPIIAGQLKNDILADMHPDNSWVIARRQMPLHLDKLNGLLEGTSLRSPVDIWPIRNTTSFALKADRPPVSPGHTEFYDHYEDVGYFPGARGKQTAREILTSLSKSLAGIAIPLM